MCKQLALFRFRRQTKSVASHTFQSKVDSWGLLQAITERVFYNGDSKTTFSSSPGECVFGVFCVSSPAEWWGEWPAEFWMGFRTGFIRGPIIRTGDRRLFRNRNVRWWKLGRMWCYCWEWSRAWEAFEANPLLHQLRCIVRESSPVPSTVREIVLHSQLLQSHRARQTLSQTMHCYHSLP